MEAQGQDDGDAEDGLRGRERELLDLPGVEGQHRVAAAEEVGDGQGADEQAPLVDLRGDERGDRRTAEPAEGEHRGDDELG